MTPVGRCTEFVRNVFGLKREQPEKTVAKDPRKRVGDHGEEIAANYLIARGYRILERNYRCKGGEVDIIARDSGGDFLVFVEVKTRRNLAYGVPQLAVTPFKQRQIAKAALFWLTGKHMYDHAARFDVVAIILSQDGNHRIDHITNAFELTG